MRGRQWRPTCQADLLNRVGSRCAGRRGELWRWVRAARLLRHVHPSGGCDALAGTDRRGVHHSARRHGAVLPARWVAGMHLERGPDLLWRPAGSTSHRRLRTVQRDQCHSAVRKLAVQHGTGSVPRVGCFPSVRPRLNMLAGGAGAGSVRNTGWLGDSVLM